jgi:hypothetical protein
MNAERPLSHRWVQIFFETFVALMKAGGIRLFKRVLLSTLPPIGLPSGPVHGIVAWVDSLVNMALFWKGGKCFYRSYSRAYVLRRRGVPLLFNFGVRIRSHARAQAHCWLTLDGQPFFEKDDPRMKFTVNMGNYKGQIYYWTTSEGS